MPLVITEMPKAIFQVLFCTLCIFGVLYFINPSKAVFPSTLVAVLLLVTSIIQKTTLIKAIRKAGVWRIFFGAIFLLSFSVMPISQNWRENSAIVPVVVALVAALFSLTKYLQARIESRNNQDQIKK